MARRSCSISTSRPTKRESPRAAAAWRRERTEPVPVRSTTGIGSLTPFTAFGLLLHRLLHPPRGVARADGVIFVREWRSEERHDPVAQHLVDSTLEAVHRLHQLLEHGIEDLPRLFGIAIGEQFHRTLQVGE